MKDAQSVYAGLIRLTLVCGAGLMSHAEDKVLIGGQDAQVVSVPLDIKFETGKSVIPANEATKMEIEKLTKELSHFPYARVEIEGYADARGTPRANETLSKSARSRSNNGSQKRTA